MKRHTMSATDREQARGFSLVEVIIAIGILAGVLLSIGSMFMLGGRQVKTGKTITEATALCHDIMEDFDARSFTALYTGLGAVATDTTRTVFSNVTGSPINPWQTEINRKLDGGVASVTMQAMGPGTPNFGTATGIRITASLTWTELGRPQTVAITTTRF
jgi:prepilin-type N-terminal cleavage/methylation domain-containing protein